MKVSISLPDELGERVDLVRGDVPRSVWMRRAVERALEESGAHQGAIVSTPSPAPAEQPPGSASRVFGWDVPLASEPAEQPRTLSGNDLVNRPVLRRPLSSPRRDVKPFQRGGS